MIALNIGLAVVPGLILLGWAYRRDSARPEPKGLVIRAFLLGFVAVAAAVAIGIAFTPVQRYLAGTVLNLYRAYFIAGLIEELAKFGVVYWFLSRRSEFDEVADGLVYAMAASIGFAVLENALYLGGPSSVLLLRGFTSVPLHASAGGIMGFYLGMDRIAGKQRMATGVLLAVLVHGTYDFLLFTGGPISTIAVLVMLISFIAVRRMFVIAVANDRDSGRVPPAAPEPLPPLR